MIMSEKPAYEELEQRIQELEQAEFERKRAEKALQESENRYHRVVEDSPGLICSFLPDGEITFVNKAYCEYFDKTFEELIGSNFLSLIPEVDQQAVMANISALTVESPTQSHEHQVITPGGDIRWQRWTNRALFDAQGKAVAYQSIGEGITERKRAEEALRESEEKYKELVEGTDDLITRVDKDGKFIFVNYMAYKIFGLAPKDCVGKSAFDFIYPDDKERTRKWFDDIISMHRTSGTIENRQVSQNGEIHYMLWTSNFNYDPYGNLIRVNGIARDITPKKQTEEALRESEEKYRDIFHAATDTFLIFDYGGNIVEANPQACEMYGYPYEEMIGLSGKNIVHPDYYYLFEKFKKDVQETGEFHTESVDVRKDGTTFPIEVKGGPFQHKGNPHLLAVVRDISNRNKAERTLRESEEKYRELANSLPQIVFEMNDSGLITFANRNAFDFFGYTQNDFDRGISAFQMLIPEDRDRAMENMQRRLSGKELGLVEYTAQRKNNSTFPVVVHINPVFHENKPVGFRGIMIDITERKRADEELQKLASVVKYSSELINLATLNGKMTFLNEAGCKMLGIDPDEVERVHIMEVIPDHQREMVQSELLPALMQGNTWQGELQYRNIKTGDLTDVHAMTFTVKEPDTQKPLFLANVSIDISERKQAEEALRKSEEKYRLLVEKTPLGIAFISEKGQYKYVNPKFVDIFGYTIEDIPTGREWFINAYPNREYRNRVISTWLTDLKESKVGEFRPRTFEVQCKDGSQKAINFKPVTLDTGDQLIIYEDITEKNRLQHQLQQAQKMESIGTLAGGIAHDFNNILSGIIGFTEIALQDTPKGSELQANLQKVLKGGDRAKDLVKQILTFSRQSELEPKPVKIKTIITEALKLLRASLPTTIEMHQNLQSNSAVMADPTQIHQILMNLCTNAGQSMQEKGGVLEVSLTEVKLDYEFAAHHSEFTPGTFIKLTVGDTGPGIPPEIQDRIFDPFFTTRGKSEGTGMGLSVVHGIVQAYGGTITIDSKPGEGAVFNIFLPVVESEDALEIKTEEPLFYGTERILFIDDEEFQVDLGRQMLERLGYKVVTETSSLKALELFRNHPEDFDLVITDLTMPKMTGDELGKEFIAIRNDIPIIILTGYSQRITEDNIKRMGFKGFAMKPVVMKELAKKIREVLDQD